MRATHRGASGRFMGFASLNPWMAGPSRQPPGDDWSSVFGLAPNTHRQSAGRANVVIE